MKMVTEHESGVVGRLRIHLFLGNAARDFRKCPLCNVWLHKSKPIVEAEDAPVKGGRE